jgi:DGQHR domain-containing protein
MSTHQFQFVAIGAKQSRTTRVFTFAAKAQDILDTCEIDRAGRTKDGQLFGFQRPQIASHIQEIRDYLGSNEAVLPNAIVVGFLGNVKVKPLTDGVFQLTVSTKLGKPGFVVDGQQRLTALSQTSRKDFEIFVSCVLCGSDEELRRQFILINNTRPLPKALIYELLPRVHALPKRLNARSFAAELSEKLNYANESALHGLIHMHTNPVGVIKDTSLQKVIMNSSDTGAIRDHADPKKRMEFGFDLLNNFYGAVSDVFPEAWHKHTPRSSRLVHGAGIVSMGFVMETLYSRTGSARRRDFVRGIEPLASSTAWTSGHWKFQDGSISKWDEIENTPRQIQRLALHLVALVKRGSLPSRRSGGRKSS